MPGLSAGVEEGRAAGRARVNAPFQRGDRVGWCEGRTRRPCVGVVLAVHVERGWEDTPQYDVQLLKRDGTPGRVTRRWHSELERTS